MICFIILDFKTLPQLYRNLFYEHVRINCERLGAMVRSGGHPFIKMSGCMPEQPKWAGFVTLYHREITNTEPQSLVVFSEYSTFYHGGATTQTPDREEGWEYFVFA